MVKKNIIVSVDGEREPQKITAQEAIDRTKIFSPYSNWEGNTYYQERKEIIHNIYNSKQSASPIGFDLEDLIRFLQEVHAKFGNMPVLYFSGKEKSFRTFELSDIDVVKSYFTVAADTKHVYVRIKNENAISFFHC